MHAPTLSTAEPTVGRIAIEAYGDASVLTFERAALPPPAAGEVRVRHTAIGVNFVDVYHRAGRYALPALPGVPGVEAAGVVEAVGPGVESLRPGQRVAYAGLPAGAYATGRNLAASRLVALPDDVDADTAASLLLRGITAHMLFTRVRPLRAGDTVLVHAAAGGLGLVLTQWAKALGATVIGTVGSAAKAELALRHGLDHAILYRERDFAAGVLELTDGHGVDYAIDGIGGQTLLDTLGAVRPFGMVASVGQVAAGGTPAIDPERLGPVRSIALARPSVLRFIADPAQYREGAQATLDRLRAGLRPVVGAALPLERAADAHRLLESGAGAGAILLRP